MSLEDLKRWRLLAPGIIGILVGLTVLQCSPLVLSGISAMVDLASKSTLLAIVIGALYQLGPRDYVSRWLFGEVNENIKKRLGAMIAAENSAWQLSPKQLFAVFYRLLDQSQAARVKLVYFNGAIVSTCGDIAVLSFAAIAGNIVALGFFCPQVHATWVLVWCCVYALTFIVLCPLATSKHLRLSNDQLDAIATLDRSELRKLVDEALGPKSSGPVVQRSSNNQPDPE